MLAGRLLIYMTTVNYTNYVTTPQYSDTLLEPTEPVFQFKWASSGMVENNGSNAGTETMALPVK